jgi:hypothetical protein
LRSLHSRSIKKLGSKPEQNLATVAIMLVVIYYATARVGGWKVNNKTQPGDLPYFIIKGLRRFRKL